MPRLLAPAEEWLLWRQCTAAATADLDLVNRASLAESLRRASALAAELGSTLQAMHASPPAPKRPCWLWPCTAPSGNVAAPRLQRRWPRPSRLCPPSGDERPVVFAGFPAPSPRLQSLVAARVAART